MNNLGYICAYEEEVIGKVIAVAMGNGDKFDILNELSELYLPIDMFGDKETFSEWLHEERTAGAWQPRDSAALIMSDVKRFASGDFGLADYLYLRGIDYDESTTEGLKETVHTAMLDISLRWAALLGEATDDNEEE